MLIDAFKEFFLDDDI